MDLNVCRICGGTENLKYILEHDPEMIEKLSKCANIHIDATDSLPKLICERCLSNLEISYRLRQQSEETQKLLRLKLEMKSSQELNKEQAAMESFITLNEENDQIELDEETRTSAICELNSPKIENYEIVPPNNLDSDTENQTELNDEFLMNSNESNVENKPTENNVMEECIIDLLSSPSRSEKSDARIDEIEYDSNAGHSFTCDTCQNVFQSRKEYASHIKQHGKERFQCIQCCKFFPTPYRLKRHEEVHSENIIHQCPHCVRTYRVLHNLRRHIRSVHANGKSFNCGVCNVSFARKDVLKRHMLLHSDEKNFICSMCSQSFKTKDYLNAHYKSRHEKNVNKCEKDNKRIISNDTKKHQCGYCGKLFKSSFSYKNHILIHKNERPYECETCKKKFRTIAAVTIHHRVHDDYRPYQCDVCLKSFKQSSHLKDHKLLHSENAPQYTCSVCQSSFAKKSNLKVHMQLHATEKLYKCAECTAEFTFLHLLQQHANKVHNRVISKEYEISDTVDLVEEDENSDICDETYEYDEVHVINTVLEEGDIEEYNSENQKPFVDFEMHGKNNFENQYSQDEDKEHFIDCIHIDSSNSIQSLPTNEIQNIESICREEIHITEHKVEVFVNEETKVTNSWI